MKQARATPAGLVGTAYWQRFSVPFEYPVVFTRGLFRQDNSILADALALREPRKRHRCLVFVDAGVAGQNPELEGDRLSNLRSGNSALV